MNQCFFKKKKTLKRSSNIHLLSSVRGVAPADGSEFIFSFFLLVSMVFSSLQGFPSEEESGWPVVGRKMSLPAG